MVLYTVDPSFWDSDWSSRVGAYSVYSYSAGGGSVFCAHSRGTSSWQFEDADEGFIAFKSDGSFYDSARKLALDELIDYLESTGRSWAADYLQIFCEDAGIGWPPDLAMELYLEQKDQIWNRFREVIGGGCDHVGPDFPIDDLWTLGMGVVNARALVRGKRI